MSRTSSALAVSLAALCFLGASSPGPFHVETTQKSPAHPRVILAHRATPDATLSIIFNAGSLDDGVASGITRLSQHMLLEANATADCRQFHQDVYESAATLSVETTTRTASFTLTGDREHFPALAQRLLRLVLSPKLVAKGLGRAKRLTLNDELVGGSMNDLLRFIAASVILEGAEDGADYASSPYGDPLVVRDLTLADVTKHVAKRFSPANATVIATGAFDRELIEGTVATLSGGKARGAFKRSNIKPMLPMRFDKMMRRELHMQVQLMELETPRQVAAARILAPLLNDHIMWRLREQGITYSTMTFPAVQEWLDFVVMVVPVANAQDVRVDKMLADWLGKIREGSLDDAEYDASRSWAISEMHRADGESAALAGELTVGLGRVRWFEPAVEAELRTLTKAQFLETVKPWLEPNSSITFVFGRRDASPGSNR
ncbi:MAG: insulinase family protein [Myxococcota bacterium]